MIKDQKMMKSKWVQVYSILSNLFASEFVNVYKIIFCEWMHTIILAIWKFFLFPHLHIFNIYISEFLNYKKHLTAYSTFSALSPIKYFLELWQIAAIASEYKRVQKCGKLWEITSYCQHHPLSWWVSHSEPLWRPQTEMHSWGFPAPISAPHLPHVQCHPPGWGHKASPPLLHK